MTLNKHFLAASLVVTTALTFAGGHLHAQDSSPADDASAAWSSWAQPSLGKNNGEAFWFRSACTQNGGSASWLVELGSGQGMDFTVTDEKNSNLGTVPPGGKLTVTLASSNCKKQPKVVATGTEDDGDGSPVTKVFTYKNGEAKAKMESGEKHSWLSTFADVAMQVGTQMQANQEALQAVRAQAAEENAARLAAAEQAAQQAQFVAQQAAAQRAAQLQAAAAQQAAAQRAAAQQAAAQAAALQNAYANRPTLNHPAQPKPQGVSVNVNACLAGPACGSSLPAGSGSDVSISQNYVDPGSQNGVTLAHYQLSNGSYQNLAMTITMSYQTGGVRSSFSESHRIAPRSSNDYTRQIPCTDNIDLSDYGNSNVDSFQFY